MARLIAHASSDERIATIMRTPEYTVDTAKRSITFRSTNHLLRTRRSRRAGRQDRVHLEGGVLPGDAAAAAQGQGGQGGQQVAVVVLGARSNAGRFVETRNLFNWLSSKAATIFADQDAPTARDRRVVRVEFT